jgi:hypothetical protein
MTTARGPKSLSSVDLTPRRGPQPYRRRPSRRVLRPHRCSTRASLQQSRSLSATTSQGSAKSSDRRVRSGLPQRSRTSSDPTKPRQARKPPPKKTLQHEEVQAAEKVWTETVTRGRGRWKREWATVQKSPSFRLRSLCRAGCEVSVEPAFPSRQMVRHAKVRLQIHNSASVRRCTSMWRGQKGNASCE